MLLLKFATICLALGIMASMAMAHPVGRVCAYTDVDGYRATDYCHHLRREQPAELYLGLPGLRLGFGGGYQYRERRRGWGGWGDGRRGSGWRPPDRSPGIQFNFGNRDRGEGRRGGEGRRRN